MGAGLTFFWNWLRFALSDPIAMWCYGGVAGVTAAVWFADWWPYVDARRRGYELVTLYRCRICGCVIDTDGGGLCDCHFAIATDDGFYCPTCGETVPDAGGFCACHDGAADVDGT